MVKNRVAVWLLTMIIAAATLAGCSAISSGTITNKVYTAAYDTTNPFGYCINRDYKSGVCYVWMPVTTHHDETFRFDLTDGEHDGWVYVGHNTYNAYEVGDTYASKEEK